MSKQNERDRETRFDCSRVLLKIINVQWSDDESSARRRHVHAVHQDFSRKNDKITTTTTMMQESSSIQSGAERRHPLMKLKKLSSSSFHPFPNLLKISSGFSVREVTRRSQNGIINFDLSTRRTSSEPTCRRRGRSFIGVLSASRWKNENALDLEKSASTNDLSHPFRFVGLRSFLAESDWATFTDNDKQENQSSIELQKWMEHVQRTIDQWSSFSPQG